MVESAEIVHSQEQSEEFLGHPKGLYVLFLTELWERFSYYGMRALLIFYATQHFLFDDGDGSQIYGTYTSLVYLLPLIGGLLADRYLGSKKAVAFGALLLSIGHLSLALEGAPAKQFVEYNGQRYAVEVEGRGQAVKQYLLDGQRRYLIGAADNGMALTGPLDAPSIRTLPAVLPRTDYELVAERDGFFVNIFFLSLATIAMGVGFLKGNISATVGMLYPKDDPRRDGGFTIFYMGINIGSVAASLFCGWLGQAYGWNWGFGAAGVGMILGLIVFLWGRKYLGSVGEPPVPERLKQATAGPLSLEWTIYVVSILGIGLVWGLFHNRDLVGLALLIGSIATVGYVVFFSVTQLEREERRRMFVILILVSFGTIFWSLFEQAGSSLNLFAQRNTDLTVFDGWQMQAAQTQFFNPGFIVLLAIPVSILWTWMGRKGIEPSTPVKFSLGLIQAGLGFLVLVLGANFADGNSQVALFWLAGAYLLHTTGELCLSPVGLSMVTKLSVPRLVGLMMGVWFLSVSFANYMAGLISAITATETIGGQVVDTAASLASYSSVFFNIGLFGVGAGILLLLLSPWIKKGMHGVH